MDRIIETIDSKISALRYRTAWEKGVHEYAKELWECLQEQIRDGHFDPEDLSAPKLINKALLNGASDWHEYSWGGCSLIYDTEIAERLCTKTELRKTQNGQKRPNKSEEWLDTQARALFQAERIVKKAIREALQEQ